MFNRSMVIERAGTKLEVDVTFRVEDDSSVNYFAVELGEVTGEDGKLITDLSADEVEKIESSIAKDFNWTDYQPDDWY